MLVDFKVTHALVGATVEVGGGGNARLFSGLRKGIEHLPAQALFFYAPLAARAVQGGKGGVTVAAGVEPVVPLVRDKVGQASLPAPLGLAGALGPMVVVVALTTHVNHAVDAAAATQRLAAWVAQAASVKAGGGLGLVHPIGARVAYAIQITHRYVDPVVVV